MILQFDDNQYIDIDSITALRQIDEDGGIVVVGGQKLGVTLDQFKVIEKGFRRMFLTIYDKDMKRLERGK